MLDLEFLANPLADDAPCGANLEYDPVFQDLEIVGAGKPEQQFGDKVYPARPPDWQKVQELALDLARRTRDLRVAMWLVRSGARLHGLRAAVSALRLLHRLTVDHWEHVHPRLSADEGNDPQVRLAALAALTPQELPYPGPPVILEDLRSARLTDDRGSPSVREVELAFGAAKPLPGELAPTEAGMTQALVDLFEQHADLPATISAGLDAVDGIDSALRQRLDGKVAPDFSQLRALLAALRSAADRVLGLADGTSPAATGSAPAVETAAVPGALNTREDVVHAIADICEWFARYEPSHPAPLLLRRAQRLVSKSFLEIMQDIAPDSIEQITRLVGRDNNE